MDIPGSWILVLNLPDTLGLLLPVSLLVLALLTLCRGHFGCGGVD
jgi:hypothetical protein